MFFSFFNRASLMLLAIMLITFFISCHKDLSDGHNGVGPIQTVEQGSSYPISLSEALNFYANVSHPQSSLDDSLKVIALNPKWGEAYTGYSLSGREILVVPLSDSLFKVQNNGRAGARLLFSKLASGSVQADLLVFVADSIWFETNLSAFDLSTFTGALAIYDISQHFRYAIYLESGVPIAGTDSVSTQTHTIATDRETDCQDYVVNFIHTVCMDDVVIALTECENENVYIETFTFQTCTTVYTGGGGSGTGGNTGNGSGSGNGSGNGENTGGNNYNPYTDFGLLFSGVIPLNVFLQNGGHLPEGYNAELFQQLVTVNKVFKFTPFQIDTLLKKPEYIPIIFDALFNPVGEEAQVLKEVMSFAFRYDLIAAQFQYLLLNYNYCKYLGGHSSITWR